MAVTLVKSAWEDGALVFRTKVTGVKLLSLTASGVLIHSLVEGADADEDINLSTIPITNQSSPAIWNDEGVLKVGSA